MKSEGDRLKMCKKRIDGIYLIKNNITRRGRVGSAKDIYKRFSNYKSALRNGNANELMQQDFNDYGEQSFEFIILEECNVADLFKREKYYQDLYSDCAKYNKNRVVNTTKKIRRGKEAKNYKEKRSAITSGSKNGNNSKLSENDVKDIRKMLLLGEYTQSKIAEIYNCSQTLIFNIKVNNRWASVQLSEEEIEEILKEKEATSIGVDTTSDVAS